MDVEGGIQEFLTSRRAKLTPEAVGLETYGRFRRVPGLRREEVAMLAGVSVDYYIRLERGRVAGASTQVLNGIARALRLDDAEREHLFDLIRAVRPGALAPEPDSRQARPSVQWLLDAMTAAPAFLRNRRLDILAANALGRALYSPLYSGADEPPNICRFVFLDAQAPAFFVDWEGSADQCVAVLRSQTGRAPDDRGLSQLVDELSTLSGAFHARWASHDVHFHDTGIKRIHHPVVGDLRLPFNRLEVSADRGLTILAYSAEPGSREAQALELLGAWTASGV